MILFDIFKGTGKKYGEIHTDVQSHYHRGKGNTVRAIFHSANPRNHLRIDDSFITVEKHNDQTLVWEVVRTDAHVDTRFRWWREKFLSCESFVSAEWDIPQDAETGKYRIRHFGHHKDIFGKIEEFFGETSSFVVE